MHTLILVAVWSRHMFVWLTFSQTTADVIEGMELAWAYFGGIFPVLIPDNLSPVITKAEPTEPRINDLFLEYSQARGFLITPHACATPGTRPVVNAKSLLYGLGFSPEKTSST